MPMYTFIEYSDNYLDTFGGFWQFKRDELRIKNYSNLVNVTTANSTFLKYESRFFKMLTDNNNNNRVFKNVETAVPLNSLGNFWRALEISLISCKVHPELKWIKGCVMSSIDGETTFQITNPKLYIPIVTLSTKGNVKQTKQLNEGFKRDVY